MDNTELVERLVKVEQSEKSAHHRLDEHENKINELSNVYVALTKVNDKVENVEKDVTEMKSDIKDIKDKPTKNYEKLIWLIVSSVVTTVLGFFLGKFGF